MRSMIPQGFPLWAVELSEPDRPYAVIGWDEHGFPLLVPLDGTGVDFRPFNPDNAARLTYTTTDPTTQESRKPARPATEWSEGDIRVVLRHIADRLDVLGATAPARSIREILEYPAGTNMAARFADLCKRMAALADELSDPATAPTAAYAARRIREAIGK